MGVGGLASVAPTIVRGTGVQYCTVVRNLRTIVSRARVRASLRGMDMAFVMCMGKISVGSRADVPGRYKQWDAVHLRQKTVVRYSAVE